MSLSEIIQKALMAGLGMQEKFSEFVDDLVKKGELSEAQGKKVFDEWSDKASKTREEFESTVAGLVSKSQEKLNITTRTEVEELTKKIDALTKKINKLEKHSHSE